MKKVLLAVLAAGLWVGASEFLRNEVLFKQSWLDKYAALNLTFPSTPINNALWALWGFVLAGCIVFLARKLTVVETTLIAWVFAFPMMWLVLWNLNVLPQGLLLYAVPWSLFEVAGAVLIVRLITRRGSGAQASASAP
jgi:hypothetical protein